MFEKIAILTEYISKRWIYLNSRYYQLDFSIRMWGKNFIRFLLFFFFNFCQHHFMNKQFSLFPPNQFAGNFFSSKTWKKKTCDFSTCFPSRTFWSLLPSIFLFTVEFISEWLLANIYSTLSQHTSNKIYHFSFS